MKLPLFRTFPMLTVFVSVVGLVSTIGCSSSSGGSSGGTSGTSSPEGSAVATKLGLTASTANPNNGVCTSVVMSVLTDSGASATSIGKVVSLSGFSHGSFYSDAACTNSISTYTLGSLSSETIYYRNYSQEIVTLQASASGLTAGTASVTSTLGNIQIYAKGYRTYITSSGVAFGFGDNFSGSLGVGNTTPSITVPTLIPNLGNQVLGIANSQYHACFLLSTGTVKCAGYNDYGQLGIGNTTNQTSPVAMLGLGGTVTAVATGAHHTCVLIDDGSVKCVGANSKGQLGNGNTTNQSTLVSTLSLGQSATAITAGNDFTCVILADTTVKCFGENSSGQLGNGSTTATSTPTATLSFGSSVTAIAAGDAHLCALLSDGSMKCVGGNSYGSLGNGNTTNQTSPVSVTGLGQTVSKIIAGSSHTCAQLADGNVKCFGNNLSGQLANGKTVSQSSPVSTIDLGSTITGLAAGVQHTCFVLNYNLVKCIGNGGYGSFGNAASSTGSAAHASSLLPSKTIQFAVADSSLTVDSSCKALVVNLKDQGSSFVHPSDMTLSFSDLTAMGNFYSTSDCSGSSITSTTLSAGQSSLNVYYLISTMPSQPSLSRLKVSSSVTGLGFDVLYLNVSGPVGSSLSFTTSSASSGSVGQCLSQQLQTLDANNNRSQVLTSAKTVTLNGASSGAFYSDSSCTNPITTLTFSVGANTANFYYTSPVDDSASITASGSGLSTISTKYINIGCGLGGCGGD